MLANETAAIQPQGDQGKLLAFVVHNLAEQFYVWSSFLKECCNLHPSVSIKLPLCYRVKD